MPEISPNSGSATIASGTSRGFLARLGDRLMEPLDILWLVVFRVAFGGIMVWEVYRFFSYDRIADYYMDPEFLFKYYGFGWVRPWPGNGMHYHFLAMGILGLMIVFGLFYRVVMPLFFLAFTYIFLLDQTRHLNHFYLVCLISFLLSFLPANRAISLDARWGFARRSETAPAWTLWLIRIQIALVYFYGGVAKISADWLRGEPVREWLADRSDKPLIGPLLDTEWMTAIFAYGGLTFDLLVGPALMWRRTRPLAFAFVILFNLTNHVVFSIGIFPWVMIAASSLFFAPGWFRNWLPPALQSAQNGTPIISDPPPSRGKRRVVLTLMGGYLAFQMLMPLRHWLYPGNVHWTEEGHRFAWHMKLRGKDGLAQFFVIDPTRGTKRSVNPDEHLNEDQTDKMATRPDMVLQFAHYLAKLERQKGVTNVQVTAIVRVSLNGRDLQLMIDPNVDLAAQKRSLRHESWIVPLTTPLPPKQARKPAAAHPPSPE